MPTYCARTSFQIHYEIKLPVRNAIYSMQRSIVLFKRKLSLLLTLASTVLNIELAVYIAQGLPKPLVDDSGALASLVESCLIISNADSSTFFSLLRPRM